MIIYLHNLEDKSSKFDKECQPDLNLFSLDQKQQKQHLIASLDDVNFNVLELNLMELHFTIFHLFDFFKFFEKYQVDLKVWQEFIWILERKYSLRSNPFHNFYHATTGK